MMSESINNWPRYVEQAYAALAPGGYFEITEMQMDALSDEPLSPDLAVVKFVQSYREAAPKAGYKVSSHLQTGTGRVGGG